MTALKLNNILLGRTLCTKNDNTCTKLFPEHHFSGLAPQAVESQNLRRYLNGHMLQHPSQGRVQGPKGGSQRRGLTAFRNSLYPFADSKIPIVIVMNGLRTKKGTLLPAPTNIYQLSKRRLQVSRVRRQRQRIPSLHPMNVWMGFLDEHSESSEFT